MLPKAKRLRLAKDFKQLYSQKKSFFSPFLTLHFSQNGLTQTRFGFIVANKIAKKAVMRNKLKRQMRAWASIILPQLKSGFDIVVSAKNPLLKLTYQELSLKLTESCKKAKLML